MEDTTPTTQAAGDTRPRGRAGEQWPQEVRELAYQYWSFAAGRNAVKVAALLQAEGYDVPARSVQYWANAGGWAERASNDLAMIAPDIRAQTVAELVYGALEAAKGLRSMVRGESPPDKTMVTAYLGMLDRGGFSPVGSNAPELPRVSVAQAAADFARMTPEERLTWERENRKGSALPAPKSKGTGHRSRFKRG